MLYSVTTEHLIVSPADPDAGVLEKAARVLRRGGLVAFPTETVYGLGADGLNARAVARIYAAKGRPADNPLILHIAKAADLPLLAREITPVARTLTAEFWPGPLTVILPKTPVVPPEVTCGLDTVAVRCPASEVALKLIELAQTPVAAPSANASGRPSPTDAAAVLADLAGRVEIVLDAGPCAIGVESTVVDCTGPVPVLLRPGGLTAEEIREAAGEIIVAAGPGLSEGEKAPRSPGMKYVHYAPAAPLVLVEWSPGAEAALLARIGAELAAGRRVGAVVSAETARLLPAAVKAAVYGRRGAMAAAAANLFAALRHYDAEPVDIIYAEGTSEAGLGLAVMNRLRKAARQILRPD